MTDADGEPRLTLDEAYRAAFHFILQYYQRERITPFMLMLSSMEPERNSPRETNDPAPWHDWVASVERALASAEFPPFGPPTTRSARWRRAIRPKKV